MLAVLGTHGGMRDKSSEQMYSDVLKHRKGKGRVKFSDTSVLEDTCANLFLHFYFFFFLEKGPVVSGSVGETAPGSPQLPPYLNS